MRTFLQISLFLSGIGLLLWGCTKSPSYSDVPAIELTNARQVRIPDVPGSDSFFFYLKFTDGDGDIGLSQADTNGSFSLNGGYYNNIIIDYFEFYGGAYHRVKPVPSNIDTIQFAYRMPVLNDSKKKKAIRGDITVPISVDIPFIKSNQCMFRIYIYDRALHKSNVVETRQFVR